MKKPKFKHCHMCLDYAEKMGGVFPKDDTYELFVKAWLRPDFGELYEMIQYKKVSGDIKDGL